MSNVMFFAAGVLVALFVIGIVLLFVWPRGTDCEALLNLVERNEFGVTKVRNRWGVFSQQGTVLVSGDDLREVLRRARAHEA